MLAWHVRTEGVCTAAAAAAAPYIPRPQPTTGREGETTGPMKLSTQTRGVQSTARDVCVAPRSDATPARVEQTDNANTDENLQS